jgi:hypothetical protein
MAEGRGEKRRGKPLSVRIAPDLHDYVISAAGASGQSITDQVNRLLASAAAVERDALMSPLQRHIARQLISRYTFDDARFGGASGVVYLLLSLEDPRTGEKPDEAECERRRRVMIEMLEAYRPLQSKPEPERE